MTFSGWGTSESPEITPRASLVASGCVSGWWEGNRDPLCVISQSLAISWEHNEQQMPTGLTLPRLASKKLAQAASAPCNLQEEASMRHSRFTVLSGNVAVHTEQVLFPFCLSFAARWNLQPALPLWAAVGAFSLHP